MKKNFLTALAISTALLGLSACYMEDDISNLPPGKYEKTVKSTDAYGTTHETTRSTKVDEDAYGNKRAVIEDETSSDPEGLLNKRTTKSTKTIEQKRY